MRHDFSMTSLSIMHQWECRSCSQLSSLSKVGRVGHLDLGWVHERGHFPPSIPCQILSLAGADRVRLRSNCTANRDMMARIAGNLLGTIDRLRSTGQTHGWSQKFPHLMETRSPKPRWETSQRAGTRSHTPSMSKSQRKAFIAGSPADGSNLLRSELIDQHENFEKQMRKSNPTT